MNIKEGGFFKKILSRNEHEKKILLVIQAFLFSNIESI